MSSGKMMIAKENGMYTIKIEGRADFECSPSLKNFSDHLASESLSKVIFELSDCSWMDSTFMGTLAMVGLKSKRLGIIVELHNANQKNAKLIKDIGIENFFSFISDSSPKCDKKWENIVGFQEDGKGMLAETILKAHETLVEAKSENAAKFGKVIDLIKEDIKK